MNNFLGKIENKDAFVGIIGMGYVGLPLAVEFGKKGFKVLGIDTMEDRVAHLNRGESHIEDVPSGELKPLTEEGLFEATTDYGRIADVDAVIICVPTPLRKTRDPDMSYIVAAMDNVVENFKPRKLIILESTTYPGTTEEILFPKLQNAGFKLGDDFLLAFSPERVDPGNEKYQIHNTPKVVGGITDNCRKAACMLYSKIVEKVIPMSSPSAAEMVKLLENTFRSVNIGLVNEFSIICDRLGLNVWEVINAASSKPFGFMPFYPGPGLGGHCIPIDPHYLSWKLKTMNYNARFIELAHEINSYMPQHVIYKIYDVLNESGVAMKGSTVLVLGIAYKKDISDVRESPALDIMDMLDEKGCNVLYNDPFVSEYNFKGCKIKNTELSDELLESADCIVITADHSSYDFERIVKKSRKIMDTRNATKGIADPEGKIHRL